MSENVRTVPVVMPVILQCNFLPVRQASRQLGKLYDDHLMAVQLTAAQFVILAMLYSNPGITMQQLGSSLRMERTSLVRALQPLTRGKFIDASRAEDDAGRQLFLTLTNSGMQKYRNALPYWVEAQEDFRDLVGERLASLLLEDLTAILAK